MNMINKIQLRRCSLLLMGACLGLSSSSFAQKVKSGVIYNQVVKDCAVVDAPINGARYQGQIVIPKTIQYEGKERKITAITRNAFQKSNALTSVEIPDGVSRILGKSFFACKNLERVTLPNSIVSIGSFAFASCVNLKEIALPKTVSSIAPYAFLGCRSIKSIKIPFGIKEIKSTTFKGCTALSSISLPKSVQNIHRDAFYGCTALSEVDFPSNLKLVGDNAFYHTALLSVDVPEGVQFLGKEVFSSCYDLKTVILPSTLTHLGKNAFSGCVKLAKVYSAIENPEQIEKEILYSKGKYENIKLLVPQGCLEAYKQSSKWKAFPHIYEQYLVVTKEIEGEGDVKILGADKLDFVPFETALYFKVVPKKGYVLASLTVNGEALKNKEYVARQKTLVKATFKKDGNALAVEQVDASMDLYPNPAANYVSLRGLRQGEEVVIYTLDGEKVLSVEASSQAPLKINLSSLEEGMYVVHTSNKSYKLEVKR